MSDTPRIQTIFVSHASEDGALALKVAEQLEALPGFRCWIAPRDVPFGAEYPRALVDAIESCDLFLLLLTEHTNVAHMVHREVERAADRRKSIYTVRLEDVQPAKELEIFISTHQHIAAVRCDAPEIAARVASAFKGKHLPMLPRHHLFARVAVAVLALGLASGVLWFSWPEPSRSATDIAELFLQSWDAGKDSQAIKFLSPKLSGSAPKELLQASLAQVHQQAGGHALQRTLIAELPFAMSPLGNMWTGLGQFEFRRFQASTGPLTRCEDVWLESPQPGQWKVVSFSLWTEPGGGCLARGDIEEAMTWVRQVLPKLDATTTAPLDPELFAPVYLSAFTPESAQRNLEAFRGKGVVSDRKLIVAFPTARFPMLPTRPGRYVFVRFLTATSTNSVWEDIWLEKPSDGSAPRVLSLVWSPAG